ncbi:MAG: 5'-methylthioadenosine/adenosylhomocysteine nucleosidase [Candidatus Methanomethylophilaceae archaeon]|nr:5'-methylthioadenosine/adenosylhomocysteine nucleosidase [Candidatus Methanomethylophilaceae archaeon]
MKTYSVIAVLAVAVIAAAACVHLLENQPDKGEPERIGIIGAMEDEVSALKNAMHLERKEAIAGMEFFVGTLGGCDVAIAQSGMGKVNAGICAQLLISEFNARAIINTGVAGSLDNRLDIEDFVVSVDAVQHDFDVSPIGFAKGEIPYTGKYAFDADPGLRAKAADAIAKSCPGVAVHQGRVCSGDQFVSSSGQKDAIIESFGGLCCEMEGAAIAQSCYLNDVPFVIIRAISDKADGSAHEDYDEFVKKAAKRSAAAVMYLLENEDP